jgi:hypothetical protein
MRFEFLPGEPMPNKIARWAAAGFSVAANDAALEDRQSLPRHCVRTDIPLKFRRDSALDNSCSGWRNRAGSYIRGK